MMLKPPAKKLGRNDRCWCGSGKKYKHCHLRQDEEDARAAAAQANLVAQPPLPPTPSPVAAHPPIPPDLFPEPSPEEAAADLEYERFDNADIEGKVAIFLERIDDKQLTGEDVFEMLLSIREESDPGQDPGARARFRDLVERLEALRPDLYREEAGFLLESLIQDAVADQDWARIPDLLSTLAENIEAIPEEFARVMQMLLYHDQGQALLPMMRESWPVVVASDKITAWGIEEFAVALLDLNLFNYLQTAAHPRADDPALTGGFPEGVSVDPAVLNPVLARFTAPEPGPRQRSDFDAAVDAETWETNAGLLVWDFLAERRRVAGTPFTRSNLMRELLLEILHDQMSWPAGGKPKKRAARGVRPLSLIPESESLDRGVGARFDPLGISDPYAVCALMELLPAYLHFIALLGLIHPTEMDDALAELSPLVQPTMDMVPTFGGDLVAVRNVKAAWSDPALDALKNDPALSEARNRALVVRPPAADPMASAQVYRFKVTYQRADDVWFVIDIPRDRTLHDLHHAIRNTANFDDDHLYSFYMSGRAWDKDTEYSSREASYSSRTRMGDLPLRIRQRFLYLFDYGDQHTFEVQLLGPSPEYGASRSWRVVETHGSMPPQYGEWEEDEETDESEQ